MRPSKEKLSRIMKKAQMYKKKGMTPKMAMKKAWAS